MSDEHLGRAQLWLRTVRLGGRLMVPASPGKGVAEALADDEA